MGETNFNTIGVDAVKVGGVAVTATPAELNILHGVTAATAELNKAADGLTEGMFIVGEKFVVVFPNIAAADVAKPFFIAPAACKLVSAYETHITVCDAADTLTIEKCNTGEAAGAGDVMLATPWTMNSTAVTPVSSSAVADGKESMVAGDSMMLKFASGDGTNYAGACITCVLKWI